MLNADIPVAIQLSLSPRERAYKVRQGAETTRRWARGHSPVTTKERFFFSLRVPDREPWTAKRAFIKRFLCVVVETLLERRAACICQHISDLVFLQPQLKHLCKDLWFTEIFMVLPHSSEDVKEDAHKMLGM